MLPLLAMVALERALGGTDGLLADETGKLGGRHLDNS